MTTTQTLHSIRCKACNGTVDGDTDHCLDCLGFGWTWSDGKAPTLCPGPPRAVYVDDHGRPSSTANAPLSLACSRYGNACTGCGRPVDEIGTAADIRATRKAKGL